MSWAIGSGPAGLACAHKLAVLGPERLVAEVPRSLPGVSDFFDTVRREQPWFGKTYYEAQGEHHSFDNYCLVEWDGDRVATVFLHDVLLGVRDGLVETQWPLHGRGKLA